MKPPRRAAPSPARAPAAVAPIAPPPPQLADHAGWAWVKRKTLAKRRQYFLRLVGGVLAAHAAPRAPVEWDESVARAAVSTGARRAAVTVTLAAGPVLHLVLPDRAAAVVWAEKLKHAASRSFEDLYQMGDKIGEGAFATVYRATEKATGEVYAVKRIRKKQFDMQMARELEREMYAMKATRHVGVVRTHNVFNEQDKVLLVLDFMKGGTLKDNVQANGGKIPEQHAVDIVRQVLHALCYLHAQGIVHRDIKLENILCEAATIPVHNIRVADFGYVNFVESHMDFCLRSLVGTPVYVAPEIINRKPYGCPADMYAVGVMLYRMLSGSYPFDAGEDDEKTMALAVKGKLTFEESAWAGTSIMCKNFVRALLQPRQERRLCARAALHHPWIEGATTIDVQQLATSPVTPYSNPPSVTKNLADALDYDTSVLGKAHGFDAAVGDTERLDSHQISVVSVARSVFFKGVCSAARWKKSIFALVFLAKLRAACGMRPMRPERVVHRRVGRPESMSGPGVPHGMRRRVLSAFSHQEGRVPRSYNGREQGATASQSLGDRIRRTLSFSRG